MRTNKEALDELMKLIDEVADRIYLDNYSESKHKKDRSEATHQLVRLVTTAKRLEHVLSKWDAFYRKPLYDFDTRKLTADYDRPHKLQEMFLEARGKE